MQTASNADLLGEAGTRLGAGGDHHPPDSSVILYSDRSCTSILAAVGPTTDCSSISNTAASVRVDGACLDLGFGEPAARACSGFKNGGGVLLFSDRECKNLVASCGPRTTCSPLQGITASVQIEGSCIDLGPSTAFSGEATAIACGAFKDSDVVLFLDRDCTNVIAAVGPSTNCSSIGGTALGVKLGGTCQDLGPGLAASSACANFQSFHN